MPSIEITIEPPTPTSTREHRYDFKNHKSVNEFIMFQILIHSVHFFISVYVQKTSIDLCNDMVFLTIINTAIFYISVPFLVYEREQNYRSLNRKKSCTHSYSTCSPVYISSFLLPILLLFIFNYPPWSNYILSTKDIPHWSIELWCIFILNTIITVPIVCYNLRRSFKHGELLFHLFGYVCIIFFLFLPYIIHTDIHLHIHHWFLSFYLSLFSRYPTLISRIFHAICMGIMVHGIGMYSPDPIFER